MVSVLFMRPSRAKRTLALLLFCKTGRINLLLPAVMLRGSRKKRINRTSYYRSAHSPP